MAGVQKRRGTPLLATWASRSSVAFRFLIVPGEPPKRLPMTWWGYALLSAACWGMQYVLLEVLFGKLEFAAAYSFLSIANGLLVALILFLIHPKQDWSQLSQSWSVIGMITLYLLFAVELISSTHTRFATKMRRWLHFWRLRTRFSSSFSQHCSCAGFI